MAPWTIAGLARDGGVGVETVRFYQRRGLLPEPDRLSGGVRRYGPADAQRLRFIRAAQSAGFTLDEIGELLALDATQDRARVRQLAAVRIAALDQRIAELTAARRSLAALAADCAGGGAGPCPILRAFEDAGAAPAKVRPQCDSRTAPLFGPTPAGTGTLDVA